MPRLKNSARERVVIGCTKEEAGAEAAVGGVVGASEASTTVEGAEDDMADGKIVSGQREQGPEELDELVAAGTVGSLGFDWTDSDNGDSSKWEKTNCARSTYETVPEKGKVDSSNLACRVVKI